LDRLRHGDSLLRRGPEKSTFIPKDESLALLLWRTKVSNMVVPAQGIYGRSSFSHAGPSRIWVGPCCFGEDGITVADLEIDSSGDNNDFFFHFSARLVTMPLRRKLDRPQLVPVDQGSEEPTKPAIFSAISASKASSKSTSLVHAFASSSPATAPSAQHFLGGHSDGCCRYPGIQTCVV